MRIASVWVPALKTISGSPTRVRSTNTRSVVLVVNGETAPSSQSGHNSASSGSSARRRAGAWAAARSRSRSTLQCAGTTAAIGSSPAKQSTVFAHERPGTCDRAASCCAPKAASWRNAVKGTCDFLSNSSRDRGLTGPPAARGQLATASPTNEENDAISGDGRQYSGGAARWRRNLAQSIHDPKKPRSAPTTADAAG